jgi:hypothetical protein
MIWGLSAALSMVQNSVLCMRMQGSKMLKTDGNKLVAEGESTQAHAASSSEHDIVRSAASTSQCTT